MQCSCSVQAVQAKPAKSDVSSKVMPEWHKKEFGVFQLPKSDARMAYSNYWRILITKK